MEVFIADTDGDPIGVVDDYASLEWKVRFSGDGSFKMGVPQVSQSIDLLQKGRLLVVDGEWYRIGQVESEDVDSFSVMGNTPFPERLCLPPAGSSHDVQDNVPAESAMKHYVYENAGAGAASTRQIPGLVVATDQARGGNVTYRARYQELVEVIVALASDGLLGWKLDHDGSSFVFDVIDSTDRSAEVFFDIEFDSILGQKFLRSVLGRKTFAYVAGAGEGSTRAIEEAYLSATEPEGWDRRESFIDARDISDTGTLSARGEQKLNETSTEDSFEIDVNMFGSFRYLRDWFLGDIVTLRNRNWNIHRDARIVGLVNKVSSASASVQTAVEMDRPWPTLRDKVASEADRPSGSSLA